MIRFTKVSCYLILLLPLLWGCKEEEDYAEGSPAQLIDISAVLVNNYWSETVYVVREVDGAESLEKLIHGGWAGKSIDPRSCLWRIYVCPGQKIRWFVPEKGGVYDYIYNSSEMISYTYDRREQTILVRFQDEMTRQINWIAGEKLHLRYITDQRIEFDSSIRDYTREIWADEIDEHAVCLRSVWTKFKMAPGDNRVEAEPDFRK